jgi:hypothetical protein
MTLNGSAEPDDSEVVADLVLEPRMRSAVEAAASHARLAGSRSTAMCGFR